MLPSMDRASAIRLDFKGMRSSAVGREGLRDAELERLLPRAGKVHQALHAQRDAYPFLDLPFQDPAPVLRLAETVRDVCDDFVLIGIGGSSLGPIALHTALSHPFHNLLPAHQRSGPRMFFLENPDPETLAAFLGTVDLKRTVVNVITKSGGTAETLANFLVVREALARALGPEEAARRIVATTDPEKGNLRRMVQEEGYAALSIPPGVGGRFSVLTAVGLFPAAVAGIDVAELLAGAAAMARRCRAGGGSPRNPALNLAMHLYLADTRRGKKVVVMMPYADALRDTADWFRQLWAESLGKRYDLKGREVHVGQTPVKALGTVDQHSQLQLYMEGPADKVVCFVRVERFRVSVRIPAAFPDLEGVASLGGHTLEALLNAEQAATQEALMRVGRPTLRITLPELSPHALGQLLYLLELATAYAGGLYRINPFDQPGVELSKRLTREKLSSARGS